jgi:hypothetical protein
MWRLVGGLTLLYIISELFEVSSLRLNTWFTVTSDCCSAKLCLTQVDRWRHSVSDIAEYVTTEKLLESIFSILPVFIRQREIQTHWVYTGWLLLMLKLSSWKKEWTSLIAFINWEFLTGRLSAIINRTRAFLNFKMAARRRNILSTLVLKSGTTFLTAALRKTEVTPRSADQLHNNKGKNVYSVSPCLREMNRINRHFVYISIDTTYNRFPYTIVFIKRWFMAILNANVNVSHVLLRLAWNY